MDEDENTFYQLLIAAELFPPTAFCTAPQSITCSIGQVIINSVIDINSSIRALWTGVLCETPSSGLVPWRTSILLNLLCFSLECQNRWLDVPDHTTKDWNINITTSLQTASQQKQIINFKNLLLFFTLFNSAKNALLLSSFKTTEAMT